MDATRLILNIIHHAERTPSLLLSIDAVKAFNRVHWIYMAQVLEKFGFKGNILSAIMVLYSTLSAQLKVSGLLSKPSNITNRTRQAVSYPRPFSIQ